MSGVLFASSLGSLHDPHCSHHPGGSDHESWPVALIAPGGGTEEHAGAHGSHGDPSTDGLPEDCTCLGGLCVLSSGTGPVVRPVSELVVDEVQRTEYVPAIPTVLVGRSDRHLQPPSTGPPTAV